MRWWRFAQTIVERVAAPRTDIVQSDRRFEALLRGSAGFRALHRVALSFHRATGTSRSMDIVAIARRDWRAVRRESRVSAAGLITATASAAVLMLDALTPAARGPFVWLLPSLALAAGVAVVAAAGPMARALDRTDS
jgi:hypothetical protein